MEELYQLIYKRKSIRKYSDEKLSAFELAFIKAQLNHIKPLDSTIKTKLVIKPIVETKAKFGEYGLLVYSEKKDHYLLNVGYMLEQFDLLMTKHDIGTCWYGMTLEKDDYDLSYVIMITFGKCDTSAFRDNMSMINRKEITEIWKNDFDLDVVKAVRLAPSAVNSQPWRFVYKENKIQVFRETALRTFIPPNKRPYFNTIDVGISLLFFEVALMYKKYQFTRKLYHDVYHDSQELLAEYQID